MAKGETASQPIEIFYLKKSKFFLQDREREREREREITCVNVAIEFKQIAEAI